MPDPLPNVLHYWTSLAGKKAAAPITLAVQAVFLMLRSLLTEGRSCGDVAFQLIAAPADIVGLFLSLAGSPSFEHFEDLEAAIEKKASAIAERSRCSSAGTASEFYKILITDPSAGRVMAACHALGVLADLCNSCIFYKACNSGQVFARVASNAAAVQAAATVVVKSTAIIQTRHHLGREACAVILRWHGDALQFTASLSLHGSSAPLLCDHVVRNPALVRAVATSLRHDMAGSADSFSRWVALLRVRCASNYRWLQRTGTLCTTHLSSSP